MTTLRLGAVAAAVAIACGMPLHAAEQRKPDAVARMEARRGTVDPNVTANRDAVIKDSASLPAPAEKTGAAKPQRAPDAVARMEVKRGAGADPNITVSRTDAMKTSEGLPAPPEKKRR